MATARLNSTSQVLIVIAHAGRRATKEVSIFNAIEIESVILHASARLYVHDDDDDDADKEGMNADAGRPIGWSD